MSPPSQAPTALCVDETRRSDRERRVLPCAKRPSGNLRIPRAGGTDAVWAMRPFGRMSYKALDSLAASSRRRSFVMGAAVVSQGARSRSLHIVVRGRLRVERVHSETGRAVLLTELGDTDVVGAISVLGADACIGSVIAMEEVETVEIDSAVVREAVIAFPQVATALSGVVSRRVRRLQEFEQLASDPELHEQLRRLGQALYGFGSWLAGHGRTGP